MYHIICVGMFCGCQRKSKVTDGFKLVVVGMWALRGFGGWTNAVGMRIYIECVKKRECVMTRPRETLFH
jgi:hypothetical protein